MIRRRAMVGGAIIVAWLAGLALLVRREYFRPQTERLTEAARRVSPGVVYYGVMQGGDYRRHGESPEGWYQGALTFGFEGGRGS